MLIARYSGRCMVCGKMFPVGTEIEYDRTAKTSRHATCQLFVPPPDALSISQGEGYGGTPYQVGEVIPNPHFKPRQTPPVPHYVIVLQATQRYYRDDGYSFGVGDESGYLYEAWVRAATEEESAPLREAQSRAERKQQIQTELRTIAAHIQSAGQRPDAPSLPQGEVVFDTQTIYGAGSLFILTDAGVWYLERHMMDGDDWRANNVAGAYCGWFLADLALVAQVRAIAATMTPQAEA